jgi:hypothetical protein
MKPKKTLTSSDRTAGDGNRGPSVKSKLVANGVARKIPPVKHCGVCE